MGGSSAWHVSPCVVSCTTPNIRLHTNNSFYEYWSRFESWRDFALKAAEHDVEEAGSREEKRWMQKENDKRCVLLSLSFRLSLGGCLYAFCCWSGLAPLVVGGTGAMDAEGERQAVSLLLYAYVRSVVALVLGGRLMGRTRVYVC